VLIKRLLSFVNVCDAVAFLAKNSFTSLFLSRGKTRDHQMFAFFRQATLFLLLSIPALSNARNDASESPQNETVAASDSAQINAEALDFADKVKQRAQLLRDRGDERRDIQKSDREQYLFIFEILVVLLLFMAFMLRLRRVKMKNRQLLTEQKLLRSQMNPHFIYNSVSNVQHLIREGKSDEAIDYLNRFSRLTRQILESSNESHISLEEEVEMLDNYCSVQQLLYTKPFEYEISVGDGIDAESIFIAPMLTQPFVENAIRHGLRQNVENGRVTARFFLKNSRLFFEVSDNGKGFDEAQVSRQHKSLSTAITKNRLLHLGKDREYAFESVNIVDSKGKISGAKVTFEIPFIYEK
jgi:signal transduction histidine kinase